MNPDGSANTQWLKTYAKYFAFHKRLVRLDNIEDTEVLIQTKTVKSNLRSSIKNR